MIFVRQDKSLIPEEVLKAAEKAQKMLEALPEKDRPAFIKKKSHIWRSFSRYLAQMSYEKCWYSESEDTQSFFDVDHFRPKLEARRSGSVVDEEGYQWLAFDWENYRLSSQRSNRLSKDEDTDETVGKGSWFPLLDGSAKACWNDRCVDQERPMLLDPVKSSDVGLLDVRDDGLVGPSRICIGSNVERVNKTCEIYGLNLPRLKAARNRVIREVIELYNLITRTVDGLREVGVVADGVPIDINIRLLKSKTRPDAPFSRAARAQLSRMPFGAEFIAMPEEVN